MIGVIADDLTGAAEIGAVGLRHGLDAEIIPRDKLLAGNDLICVDTDSRACSREEAAWRVAAAAGLLRKAGATWIYKKVDSVLRGHVTAEVEAVMKQLQYRQALVAPANPSLGRTIRDERYFVKGKPIHKTEFARDPEYPRTSAHIFDLLGKGQTYSISICDVDDVLPEDGIIIGEAASSADVAQWTKRIDAQKTLAAGGAEFFSALLKATGHQVSPGNNEPMTLDGSERKLFVCGTISESSKAFLRTARKQHTPVFSLPIELLWGAEFSPVALEAIARRVIAAFQLNSRIILTVGQTQARDKIVSRKLVEHLVQLAKYTLREVNVNQIYAEGGATAAELARRMGWPRLTVSRELSPGVVVLAVAAEQSRFLTIKPGSYIWPETILRGVTSANMSATHNAVEIS